MNSVNVFELKELIDSKKDFQLIDVREKNEFEVCDLGGILIPLNTIPDNIDKISKEKMVVVHCRSGKRSASAIQYLEQNFGFKNLYNLEGGILAWADEIDDSMPKY
ncbi:MAG: rhodanese-like domain-containing protein [Bacteroidetes bacterium]|nr:MAG: rhodanese-like domain-containing protein [Bacteroidota bacterium]